MPVSPQWSYSSQTATPTPVRVARKPKKVAQAAAPPTPEQSARQESDAAAFVRTPLRIPSEFTADLPDPAVVGLSDTRTRPDIQMPAPQMPADESEGTEGHVPTYPADAVPVSSDIAGAPPLQYDRPYREGVYGSQAEADAGQAQKAQAAARAAESPTDRDVREKREALDAANAEKPKKRHGLRRALSMLEGFVIEGGRPFRTQMPRTGQELAYGMGRGISGGAYSAVKSEYPSQVRIEARRQQAGEQYDEALKRQGTEQKTAELRNKGIRESRKIELKALLDNAKLRQGDRRMTEAERSHRAAEALRKEGLINDDEELELHRTISQQQNEDRDLDRAQRDKQFQMTFDTKQRQLAITNKQKDREIEIRRKVAERGGGEAEVRKQTAASDVDIYENEADEIQDGIDQWNAADELTRSGSAWREQAAKLQGQLRTAKRNADKARARAGEQTKASVSREQLKAIADEGEVRRIAAENGKNADSYVKLWKELRGQK